MTFSKIRLPPPRSAPPPITIHPKSHIFYIYLFFFLPLLRETKKLKQINKKKSLFEFFARILEDPSLSPRRYKCVPGWCGWGKGTGKGTENGVGKGTANLFIFPGRVAHVAQRRKFRTVGIFMKTKKI